MKGDIRVTEEEMKALFPHNRVLQTQLEKIRPRILTRCLLIVLIFAVRAVVVTYYPEFHLVTIYNERLLGADAAQSMTQIRLILAFFGCIIYLYSFYKNLYFRYANVIVLIVLFGLIWSDIEALLLLSSFGNLTLPSLGLIAVRFIAVVLLWQNYRDLR
jgi:hypothetical protein